jgi:hypothetical protein
MLYPTEDTPEDTVKRPSKEPSKEFVEPTLLARPVTTRRPPLVPLPPRPKQTPGPIGWRFCTVEEYDAYHPVWSPHAPAPDRVADEQGYPCPYNPRIPPSNGPFPSAYRTRRPPPIVPIINGEEVLVKLPPPAGERRRPIRYWVPDPHPPIFDFVETNTKQEFIDDNLTVNVILHGRHRQVALSLLKQASRHSTHRESSSRFSLY